MVFVIFSACFADFGKFSKLFLENIIYCIYLKPNESKKLKQRQLTITKIMDFIEKVSNPTDETAV